MKPVKLNVFTPTLAWTLRKTITRTSERCPDYGMQAAHCEVVENCELSQKFMSNYSEGRILCGAKVIKF